MAGYHLTAHELIHDFVVAIGILADELLGTLVLLTNDTRNLFVYNLRPLVAVGVLAKLPLRIVVADVGEFVAHAVVHHHGTGYARGLLHVVESAGAYMAQKQLLGGAATHEGADLVKEHLLGHAHALYVTVQVHAQSLPPWNNAYLDQRIAKLNMPAHGSVSGFVYGGLIFVLFCDEHRFVFETHCHLIDGFAEVMHCDGFLILAGCHDGSFVAHIGDLSAAHASGLGRQFGEIDIGSGGLVAQVYFEYGLAVNH